MSSGKFNRQYAVSNRQIIRCLLLTACCLLFTCFTSFARETDSLQRKNQQYGINDPRNPNCPCHKVQKKAEDEYRKSKGIKSVPALTKGEKKRQKSYAGRWYQFKSPHNHKHAMKRKKRTKERYWCVKW